MTTLVNIEAENRKLERILRDELDAIIDRMIQFESMGLPYSSLSISLAARSSRKIYLFSKEIHPTYIYFQMSDIDTKDAQ